MKKNLLALAIAGAVIAPTQADTIGFEVGATYWDASISGETKNSNVEDYNKSSKENEVTSIYALLEHPIPVIPNVKIASTQIENKTKDGSGTIDTSFNDFLLYYEVLDNIVELDLGLGARQFTGEVSDPVETIDLDPTLPTAYGKAQFNLPVTGLSAGASVLLGSTGDDKTTDAEVYVRWESTIGLGITGGYRMLQTEIEGKEKLSGDKLIFSPEYDGVYLSAFFHF